MFTHDAVRRPRRVWGRPLLMLAMALVLSLGGSLTSPAAAQTPEAWEQAPDVSLLGFLLVLFIIPIGLAAVIALLTVLPSLASDRGYEPGQSWRSDVEWFGGPTKGVESAADVTPEQIESRTKDSGGTSARW